MSPPELITSLKNPRVKAASELVAKRRARDEAGLFAVEGAREASRALASGFELTQVFACAELAGEEARGFLAAARGVERLDVTVPVFAKLVVREGSDGVLAIYRQRRRRLADLQLDQTPLILAVHGVEKPGNLGALLRSADGVGVDAVVLLDGTVDVYNPHVIRGSVGAVFALPVVQGTSAEFRAYCKQRGVRILAAALTDGSRVHHEESYVGATAVLVGSEAEGLPEDWVQAADGVVRIAMRGVADSLNVSVAGAVILYEALRQRSSRR